MNLKKKFIRLVISALLIFGGYKLIEFSTTITSPEEVKMYHDMCQNTGKALGTLDAESTAINISTGKTSNVKFTYQVDGKDYRGEHFLEGHDAPPSPTIEVYYDTQHPSFYSIEAPCLQFEELRNRKPLPKYRIFYGGLLAGLIGLGFAIWALVAMLRGALTRK